MSQQNTIKTQKHFAEFSRKASGSIRRTGLDSNSLTLSGQNILFFRRKLVGLFPETYCQSFLSYEQAFNGSTSLPSCKIIEWRFPNHSERAGATGRALWPCRGGSWRLCGRCLPKSPPHDSIHQQIFQQVVNMEPISDDEINHSQTCKHVHNPSLSSNSLLSCIKDPQMFMSVVGTLCSLATEAGGDSEAVDKLAKQMLAARGLHPSAILKNLNQSNQNIRAHKEKYNALRTGATHDDIRGLLSKIERETVAAKEQEEQYYALQSYRERKQEEIAPALGTAPTSRKERFKQIIKNKYGPRKVQGGHFYQSNALETLRNGYHAQNDCYLTMGGFQYLKTLYGHASEQEIDSYSPIFNALYDQSEQLLLSGGEEGLVKVWHRRSGTLIGNLKGHTDFINKIEVSPCNRYIATCAGDGIRFFDLKTLKSLGGWKSGSIVEISIRVIQGQTIFMFGDDTHLYLLTEQTILEKSQGLESLTTADFTCISFASSLSRNNVNTIIIAPSPDETHLLLGLENGEMIVIEMAEVLSLLDIGTKGEDLQIPTLTSTRIHGDEIVEVKWREDSSMWATGSRDGRCCLWELRNGRPAEIETLSVNRGHKGRKKRIFACSYICWNCTYSHFAAGFQEVLEEEDNERGQGEVLIYSLAQKGVTCEVSRDVSLKIGGIKAMDAHPFYPNILLICEAEGHIILFDLFLGSIVNVFEERGFHMLHPQFNLIPSECRFSRDGMSFLVASEYGSVSLYGYDAKPFYYMTPTEQFLTTDFVEFHTEPNSMRVSAVSMDFPQDLNCHPRGPILSIKGDPHYNQLEFDRQSLMSALLGVTDVVDHKAVAEWDEQYRQKLTWWMEKGTIRQGTYWRTYEQIQSSKQLILFHQRERQFAKINTITEEKLNQLRIEIRKNKGLEDEVMEEEKQKPPMFLRNKRKTKRRTQRAHINYADDFQYDQGDEEDYNAGQDFLQNDLPDQEEEEESFSEREHQHRFRRRDPPRRERRSLRGATLHLPLAERSEEILPQFPQRRRKEHNENEIHELAEEVDSRPRKKVKEDDFGLEDHPEDESRPRLARLRKCGVLVQMEEESIDCYRCQATKATKLCYDCEFTQRFCDRCSTLRGRKQNDKYRCLFCLFINNESPEQLKQVDESAYRAVRREGERYIPQIEDKVRFLFQGYEQFLVSNVSRLNNRVTREDDTFRLLPHTQNTNLIYSPLCVVERIKYYYPLKAKTVENGRRGPGRTEDSPIQMLVGLRTQDNYYIQVFYTGVGEAEYLLREEVYQQMMMIPAHGLEVNQLVKYQGEEVQVIEIGPLEEAYSESIYKTVRIRKTEGKRLRGNTKQIEKRVNVWHVCPQINMQNWICQVPEGITDRLVAAISEWLQGTIGEFAIFADYVDFDIWPQYRSIVPVGMCLRTIRDRLINHYYRSEASLKEDILLINSNSVQFNGPHQQVTKGANNLLSTMMALLNDQELPPTAQKSVQDSSSKREKRKRESVEAIISGQPTGNGLMLRSRATRRKKKISSDYEEDYDQDSDSQVKVGVLTRNNGRTSRLSGSTSSLRMTRSRLKP